MNGSSEEELRRVGPLVRTWGRWGPDDERGTLNYITDEHRRRAAGLIRLGKTYDLGLPLDAHGPQRGGLRTNPVRLMSATDGSPADPEPFRFADDYVVMPLQAGTQWDALGHVWYDGQLYNGYPSSEVTARGLGRLGIQTLTPGVVGRGVLLDVARHRGRAHLDAGEPIGPDDLTEVATAQGVKVGTGDVLLVRTGWRTVLARGRRDEFMSTEPGLTLDCAMWLHDRGIAALVMDNPGIGVRPGRDELEFYVVHLLLIRDLGLVLGELFDLEALGAACAADGTYEFLFCGNVLRFTNGCGTPTNPVVIR